MPQRIRKACSARNPLLSRRCTGSPAVRPAARSARRKNAVPQRNRLFRNRFLRSRPKTRRKKAAKRPPARRSRQPLGVFFWRDGGCPPGCIRSTRQLPVGKLQSDYACGNRRVFVQKFRKRTDRNLRCKDDALRSPGLADPTQRMRANASPKNRAYSVDRRITNGTATFPPAGRNFRLPSSRAACRPSMEAFAGSSPVTYSPRPYNFHCTK